MKFGRSFYGTMNEKYHGFVCFLLVVASHGIFITAVDTDTSINHFIRHRDLQSGPSLVFDINAGSASSFPQELVVFNQKLYFAADDGSNGRELWQYDGTNNPSLVSDIYAGSSSSNPGSLCVYKDKLYFFANNADGLRFWAYSGSGNPTIVSTSFNFYAAAQKPPVYNDKLYLSANGGLWQYDGTNLPILISSTSTNPDYLCWL